MTQPADAGRLEMNARAYRYDPVLDPAADLFHTDIEAWKRLPPQVQDLAGIHADLRDHYRRAVNAGAIPDDRGPAA